MDSNNEGISAEVGDRIDDLFGDGGEPAENFEDKETEAAVSDRLDDLFGDSGEPAGEPENKPAAKQNEPAAAEPAKSKKPKSAEPARDADNSPLKDLKSVVLSLEWEITDQVMQRLGEEITKLEGVCKDDKIIIAFLQLLGSLGKYIQKKRAEAHPDSISLLNSVYENLETAMLSNDLSDPEKKKLLIGEVNKYKKLKELIADKKRVPRPVEKRTEEVEEEEIHEPEPSVAKEEKKEAGSETVFESSDVVVQALNELNKTIKSEFKALREELRMMRQRR